MDSLRLDSWVLGWNIQLLVFIFFSLNGGGEARDGKVVYMTYTIFSKIPMMTDDDE